MSRIWKETVSPAYLNKVMGVYANSTWMKQMDRCWDSDDGYQVCSRLLRTKWGNVEHATIKKLGTFSNDGSADIPWGIKMEIKNELFGEDRLAIEVFPKQKNLVDVMDIYHLWVFSKDFDLPFGIHPIRDQQPSRVNRGTPNDITQLVKNTKEMVESRKIDVKWSEGFEATVG